MATNEAKRMGSAFVYTCSCGQHCSPRCPHLDMDLANDDPDVVAHCDLFCAELDRETKRRDSDPIIMARRSPRCVWTPPGAHIPTAAAHPGVLQ